MSSEHAPNNTASFELEPRDAHDRGLSVWPADCLGESSVLRELAKLRLSDGSGNGSGDGDGSGPIPVPELDYETLESLRELICFLREGESVSPEVARFVGALRRRWERQEPPKHEELTQAPVLPDCPEQLAAWMDARGQEELRSLLVAANYLDIPLVVKTVSYQLTMEISRICTERIAQIRDLSDPNELELVLEPLRRYLRVENDFEPEEYERLKREHLWCIAALQRTQADLGAAEAAEQAPGPDTGDL